MTGQGGHDRLFGALNPLVMEGTLTPYQADRVYRAVGAVATPVATPGPTGGGGAVGPATSLDQSRLLAALSVLAAGLLATAYVVAAIVDQNKDTSWQSTVVLLGSALLVAGAAAAWLLLLRDDAWAGWVSGVLGAVGVAGLLFSLLVLWDSSDTAVYLTGLLMLAGGAAGFWFLKGQLFTLVAVFGGVLVLGQIFIDSLGGSGDEGDILTVGIAFLFYGLVVGALGWFLGARRLLGFVGLFIAGFAMFLVMILNGAFLRVVVAFSDPAALDSFSDGSTTPDSVRTDIRVAMFLGLLVVAIAALAHALDGFVGFSVLAFVGAAVLPVTAFYSWDAEHPLRWAVGFAFIGTLGLAAIIGVQLDRNTLAPPSGYAGQPMGPDQGPDPHADTISR